MSLKDSNKFVFEYPLAQIVIDGISDLYTTRVALPEGAKILGVDTAGIQAEVSFDKTFSYLDFIGRPTVVVKIKNHVPKATEGNLKITYQFQKHKLLIEPLYIVCGLFGIFATTIILGRMNLDFKKD